MLEHLKAQPADKILALMQAYRKDPRTDKIDLGVGVYKNATGVTPIMRAVKKAEQRILDEQKTKAYVALAGDLEYLNAMIGLVLGDKVNRDKIAAVATPGGTGAIRQAFEMIKGNAPETTIWYSDPTWPNHISILNYLKIKGRSFSYFDESTRLVNFEGMISDLAAVKAGDVILLHGCCHNPTGANLTPEQWDTVIDLINKKNAIAMVDIAYQGFGDGLTTDGNATRKVASGVKQCLITASCSKNFGIYRERTGVLIVTAENSEQAGLAQGNLEHLNRQNYSFPPDHGSRVVTTILNDPELRADWEAELEEVRLSMLSLRQQLADELRRLTNSDRFDFIAEHRGMFSRLGISKEKVDLLREKKGIYMVGDSRINIAGLNKDTVPLLAKAIIEVGV